MTGTRNRRRQRKSGARAFPRQARNDVRPMVASCPADPPQVRRNPVFNYRMEFVPDNPTAGVYNLTAGSIRNRLIALLGMPTPNFIIKDVYAWGPSGNFTISGNDFVTGIQAFDAGGFDKRPGIHIHYPVSARNVYNANSTGDINTFSPGVANDPAPQLQYVLDVWDAGQTE